MLLSLSSQADLDRGPSTSFVVVVDPGHGTINVTTSRGYVSPTSRCVPVIVAWGCRHVFGRGSATLPILRPRGNAPRTSASSWCQTLHTNNRISSSTPLISALSFLYNCARLLCGVSRVIPDTGDPSLCEICTKEQKNEIPWRPSCISRWPSDITI